MKKLINDPARVTNESIKGFVKANSRFVKQVNPHVIARKNAPIKGKVGVVCGGGSGHEPLFIGFVGYGMADAAVLGEVFAAPAPPLIVDATRAANGGEGVLYVYGNYPGDNMNFDSASEMVAAEGIHTETVRVWDDIASAPPDEMQNRRGIASDLFVIKVAGAKAETGANLKEVKRVTEKARDNCRSYAVALSPGSIPATGEPTFQIGENEMYFGVGAHGEKGVEKTELKTADETSEILTKAIVEDLPFKKNDEVNLIVNGYGSTTLMELFIINRKVHQFLEKMGIEIHQTEVGNFLTTQEMAGCSVSLMRLDEELKDLYDSPAYTSAIKKLPDLRKFDRLQKGEKK